MATGQKATYSGMSLIWNKLKGNSVTEPLNIGWGDALNATANTAANPDVNLFKPQTEARTAGTSTLITTTMLADTYKVIGTITCLVGAKTITEAALFDTSTLSPTTTLTPSLTAATTVFTVGSATGLPAASYYLQLENEVVLVTATSGTTTLTVTRGRNGSTSAVHASGAVVTLGGDGGAGTGGATSGQTATVGASVGGNIFVHADFAGIALSVNDSINFTFSSTLTS